jgi:hypothetical protein
MEKMAAIKAEMAEVKAGLKAAKTSGASPMHAATV